MKALWKNEKNYTFAGICAIILLCQIILIGYCNFALSPKYIDCDGAMLFVHAIEMARNHSYIIPEWNILTTLEWDCSLLFAMPLFLLFQNIYAAFSISNLLMVFILIGVLFFMFEGKSIVYPLLSANFILIPYSIGQLSYFNMLFFNGGQYIIKVLLPLMLIALLIQVEKGTKPNAKFVIWCVVYSVLLLISAISSGVYVPAVGIVPVLLGYLGYSLYCRKKIAIGFWGVSVLSGVISVVGLVGNKLLASGAKGNSMTLCSIVDNELWDNIVACFFGMFELFNGVAYENLEVMSFGGIRVLLHMAFVVLLLFLAGIMISRIRHKKASMLGTMLLTVFVWNTFILCVCQTRYGTSTFEFRYHLVGMVPLLCAGVLLVVEWFEKEEKVWKSGIATVIICMLAVLNITSYKGVFSYESNISEQQQICKYIENSNIETVYFLHDSTSAEICRLIDYKNEDTTYLAVTGGGEMMVYNYYSKYLDMPVIFENAVLVVNDDYFEFEDIVELFGHQYKRIDVIGGFSIYQ